MDTRCPLTLYHLRLTDITTLYINQLFSILQFFILIQFFIKRKRERERERVEEKAHFPVLIKLSFVLISIMRLSNIKHTDSCFHRSHLIIFLLQKQHHCPLVQVHIRLLDFSLQSLLLSISRQQRRQQQQPYPVHF